MRPSEVGRFIQGAERTLGRRLSTRDRLLLTQLAAHPDSTWAHFVNGAAGLLSATEAERARLLALENPPPQVVPPPPEDGASPTLRGARIWAVVLALVVVVGLGVSLMPRTQVDPIDPPDSTPTAAPRTDAPASGVWTLKPIAPATVRTETTPPGPRDLDAADGGALLGILVAGAGLALLGLAVSARVRWSSDRARAQQAAAEKRAQLDLRLPPPARSSAFSPLSVAEQVETATLLGELADPQPGDELDGEASALATAAAGGRFTPVFFPRLPQATITVLIDEEEDGHAWLPAFHRLVDDWERHGVRVERYTFAGLAMTVRSEDGRRLSIEELAREVRRRPGEGARPLLLLSRQLNVEGVGAGQRYDWPSHLTAWAPRVWLDPRPDVQGAAALAEHVRVQRFPFTEEGIHTASQCLAGAPFEPVEWPRLPAPKPVPLWKWTHAASAVPDATWDQIERIRQAFIKEDYPKRWHANRLLVHVGDATETDAGAGPRMLIPRKTVNQWLRLHERREHVGFAEEVRRMLIEELEHRLAELERSGQTETLDAKLTGLRILRHRAHVELTEEVVEELAAMLDGPVGAEAWQVLVDLDATGRLDRADDAEAGAAARAWGMLRGARMVSWRSLVGRLAFGMLAACIGVVVVAGFLVKDALLAQPASGKEISVPATWEVVESGDDSKPTVNRPAMLPVAPGSFVMGSPEDEEGRLNREKQHLVTLTRGFWLARTEVTQGQWTALMGENLSYFQGQQTGGAEHPVENVNWFEAIAYVNALSKAEGLEQCYDVTCSGEPGAKDFKCSKVDFKGLRCLGYRLPTEAEWEYSARAGTIGPIYQGVLRILGGHNAPALDPIAWYGGNSGTEKGVGCSDWDEKQYPDSKQCGSQPVARKAANPWGFFDMLGNVLEWTNDPYTSTLERADDPLGGNWSAGARRVYRSCGWSSDARGCRAAFRGFVDPSRRLSYLGLRPARSFP